MVPTYNCIARTDSPMKTLTLTSLIALVISTSAIAAEPAAFFSKYCHDDAGKTGGLLNR